MIKFLFLLGISSLTMAWNAKGHQLVAELALTYVKPDTKHWLQKEFQSAHTQIDEVATWMDDVRRDRQYAELRYQHYINLSFGKASLFPKQYPKQNALTAIESARQILLNPASSQPEQIMALRILIHVIADIHQPLHVVSYYSKRYPHGDKGGNLYPISKLKHYHHLHQFWDDGAGYLSQAKLSDFSANACRDNVRLPFQWVQDSYAIAVHEVYFPPYSKAKMQTYQLKSQGVAKLQIQKAACHLAAYLDDIYSNART
jgi:hypothetical protein